MKKNYFIGKILKNPKPQTPKLCTLNTNYSSLQDHTSWSLLFYFLSTLKYWYCQKSLPENTPIMRKRQDKFCLSFWDKVLLGFWGWTGTCYVAQAGHELTFFHLSLLHPGIHGCITTLRSIPKSSEHQAIMAKPQRMYRVPNFRALIGNLQDSGGNVNS